MASDATEGEQPQLGKCGGAVRIAGLCCAVLLQKRTRARAKRTKGVLVGWSCGGVPHSIFVHTLLIKYSSTDCISCKLGLSL